MKYCNYKGDPFKKIDGIRYYYDEDHNLKKVPGMISSTKEDLMNFVYLCMKDIIGGLSRQSFENLWEFGEQQKIIILGYLDAMKRDAALTAPRGIVKYKITAYNNAIKIIKKLKVPLLSAEQALNLPGIGKSIATKIEDVISTQRSSVKKRTKAAIERMTVVDMFLKIWGVGPAKANEWYDRGYRTIDDIPKEDLTKQMIVGLKYYDDLLLTIPRSEMSEYEKIIDVVLKKELGQDVMTCLCGSYRRGAATSGDVDILVTKKHEIESLGAAPVKKIVAVLENAGIIMATPVIGSVKFMGIGILPHHKHHRHIDIRCVPYESWPAAQLYFTGSKEFNIKMRIKAAALGYKLNEFGLYEVEGNREVPTETEHDIFAVLHMAYVSPENR